MVKEQEPGRDLVVIGASAGGLEVLRRLVSQLPTDFGAAVCVVLHISPASPSALAPILHRAGALPCRAAQDGDSLRPGCILVAPPNRHLIIEGGRVRLTTGPRENGHRPAVDTLFRSAAAVAGARVVGVILSGAQDDGSAGLAEIKAGGGAAVVQDPEEAAYAGMPSSALAHVAADAVVRADALAGTLTAVVNGTYPTTPGADPPPSPSGGGAPQERKVTTVCPECGGLLSERPAGPVSQWECRVGHRYSLASLDEAQAEGVEAALWAAIRSLEDRERLLSRMAADAEARDHQRSARTFRRRAAAAGEHAGTVRRALNEAAETSLKVAEDSKEKVA